MSKKMKGFSLIELAIVMTIASLLMMAGIKAVTALRFSGQHKSAQQQMVLIEEAIRGFVLNNGRLPCPADPSLASSNALWGRELTQASGTLCDNPSGDLEDLVLPANSGTAVGALPFYALGFNAENIDTWGHHFTYHVVLNKAHPNSADNGKNLWTDKSPSTLLTVNDDAGNLITNKAIAIIVSHGSNGSGAWTVDGARITLPVSTAVKERENLDTATGSKYDLIYENGRFSDSDTTPFDDYVLALTIQNILDPLSMQGLASSPVEKHVEALAKVNRLAQVVIAFSVAQTDPPSSGARLHIHNIPDDSGFLWSDVGITIDARKDPWGNDYEYNVITDSASETNSSGGIFIGTGSPDSDDVMFRIYSKGEDGGSDQIFSDLCTPTSIVFDDICIIVTFNEAIAIYTQSGIPIDNVP